MRLIATMFGLRAPVSRGVYASVGLTLAALKYATDFALVRATTGQTWSLTAYLTPSLAIRQEVLGSGPTWVAWVMVAYALPFAWIGLSMSVRRAADAGLSPWWGIGFLLPFLNYIVIAVLCFIPSRGRWQFALDEPPLPVDLKTAMVSVAVGVTIALLMLGLSVYALGSYGSSLFIGTPMVIGLIAGYLTNRHKRISENQTLSVATTSIVLSGVTMLLFGAEGILCLAMAFIPALFMAWAGAAVGRAIALATRHGGPPRPSAAAFGIAVLALPLAAGLEAVEERHFVREVVTSLEIDATPLEVWSHVTEFSELAPPDEWLFASGIAYPTHARLEGRGVGAVRHCEFSTGPFVEPITRWQPGKVLSFDVVAQPPPMQEWSPYANVHPPHLDGYFRSVQGEFRFVELANGKTRLEGSTWYELDIAPVGYWSLIADFIVHRIHERVLKHIKGLSEPVGAERETRGR